MIIESNVVKDEYKVGYKKETIIISDIDDDILKDIENMISLFCEKYELEFDYIKEFHYDDMYEMYFISKGLEYGDYDDLTINYYDECKTYIIRVSSKEDCKPAMKEMFGFCDKS